MKTPEVFPTSSAMACGAMLQPGNIAQEYRCMQLPAL
eukprot:CAMPEP_0168454370 /NCGR_PEP_ID=MMETSP0228-20121227/50185_1 /TAXON_ID=133427 /ORGANISM="Protoceratium reticulatum, Strain CCCM 535 (=CCMP 1889)" /LENGTH=36 /DNA_ID= /DNA_START= /DNA_END= /DNA_ORIENTATION=